MTAYGTPTLSIARAAHTSSPGSLTLATTFRTLSAACFGVRTGDDGLWDAYPLYRPGGAYILTRLAHARHHLPHA